VQTLEHVNGTRPSASTCYVCGRRIHDGLDTFEAAALVVREAARTDRRNYASATMAG